jgi:Protein of unknown function with HXXEE motif
MAAASIVAGLRWAVPVCFGLHIIEEFFWPGGFRVWYRGYRPQVAGTSQAYYYKANAVYFTAALLVPLLGHGPDGVLIWSGILFCNLIFTHVRGALKTGRYSPGIVTGCVLYVPLFAASYGYLLTRHVVSFREALVCLLVSPIPEIYFALKKAKVTHANAAG